MNESMIKVNHLVKSFKNFTAVDGLDLTIRKGEYMGLLGPNGAGKSTTLKSIAGLIFPTSGNITINGYDISTERRRALSCVGTVIETPEFYPNFTPAEGMDYVGSIYGLDKKEIEIRSRDVLEELGMWDWRNKPMKKFSKGMRQRVMIAQAMLPNPDILILDEPTSGLDPRGMIEVRRTLNDLKHFDMTLLISTHILKEVSEVCSHVTMIDHGRTVVSGDVGTLLHDTATKSSRVTIRTKRDVTAEVSSELRAMTCISGYTPVNDREMRFDFSGTDDDMVSVSDLIHSEGLGILSMNVEGADLEDLYMELTRKEEANVR